MSSLVGATVRSVIIFAIELDFRRFTVRTAVAARAYISGKYNSRKIHTMSSTIVAYEDVAIVGTFHAIIIVITLKHT